MRVDIVTLFPEIFGGFLEASFVGRAIAGGQRHYYTSSDPNCGRASTIAVTVLAGPLNYAGINPKVSCRS